MLVSEIDMKVFEEDGRMIGTINCPVCDIAWLKDCEGEYERGKCPHLRFIWTEGGLEYFGQWDTKGFEEQFRKEYTKVSDYGEDYLQNVQDHPIDGFTEEVLIKIECPGVDEVLSHTETGLACGPVSMTVLYGIET